MKMAHDTGYVFRLQKPSRLGEVGLSGRTFSLWFSARRSDRPKQARMSLRASVMYDRSVERLLAARRCWRT
jgi:hypothetical protein